MPIDPTSARPRLVRNKANLISSDFYNLPRNASLTQQAVLKPKYYASRVPGTSKYKLNLTNVRNTTKLWFAPVN